jgi:protein involved in sex pheromone biosynthesis
MFNKKKNDEMLVEENQYRAVITYIQSKRGWSASVQRRIDINEWEKVRCGLKGMIFESKEQAEGLARHKIKLQKALDNVHSRPVSYIIYDD